MKSNKMEETMAYTEGLISLHENRKIDFWSEISEDFYSVSNYGSTYI
jgi:hypothetical protein